MAVLRGHGSLHLTGLLPEVYRKKFQDFYARNILLLLSRVVFFILQRELCGYWEAHKYVTHFLLTFPHLLQNRICLF